MAHKKLTPTQTQYLERITAYLKANPLQESDPALYFDAWDCNVYCDSFIKKIWFTGATVFVISKCYGKPYKRTDIDRTDITRIYKNALRNDEDFNNWITNNYNN